MTRHKGRDEARTSPPALLLDELEEGINQRQWLLESGDLELDDSPFRFPEALRVSLRLNRSLQTFSLAGTIHCRIGGECGRCLEPAEQLLEAPVSLLVQRQQASAEEREAVAEDEDVVLLDPGAKHLDLKERLREAVLLELPVRLYCREDCKGLCSHCGHNLNTGPCACVPEQADPRWAALGKLKFS